MTNEQINHMELRGYLFGDHKGVEVNYDKATDAVVLKEHLFRYLLSLIPSPDDFKIPDKPVIINGYWITDKDFESLDDD